MPNLFALLVAIDEYPIERHRLNGCNNDLQDFKNFLEESTDSDQFGQTQIKTLTDAGASRQNVIDGFSLFDSAEADDVCVFYFCGHGSQSPAPKEFWHLAPDKMNESILCWDSRTEGGRDLMDKELSYLIWKATDGKDLKFVAIMDCCHSGSNTRDPGISARMAEAGETLTTAEDYLGYSQYKITNSPDGTEASPPRGKHIHLAAAKNSETAKELRIDGKSRGIFTYSFLNVLRQSEQAISYGELINRTGIRIRSKVSQQSPQAEASDSGDLLQAFLGGIKNKTYNLLVSHNESQGWIVNAGAVQGLKVSDSNNGLFLQLKDHPNQKVLVTNVSPNQSTLSGLEGLATDQVYNAQLIHEFKNKLTIALDDDDDRMEQMQLLLDIDNTFITVVPEQEAPRYLLSANDSGFQLSSTGKGGFSFAAVNGHQKEAAAYFISKLEKIARWNQLLSLSNPTTRISSKDLKIELFKNMDPGNLEDDTTVKPLNWILPESFEYVDKDGLQQPAFQLKITNTGSRALWVSALYMGFDFSITNHLLAKQELNAGESVWLADVYEGYPYRTIPLQVDDLFYQAGLRKVTDYIKIIASTDEIDTETYNQERLYEESEILEATRGLGRRSRPETPDWATREIELKIIREEEEDKVEMAGPPDTEEPATRGPVDKVIAPSSGGGDITFSDVTDEKELPTALSTSNTSTNKSDEVDCSVYAAPEGSTGDDLFVQVWLHLPELKAAAAERAKEFDDEAEQRAYQSLSLPLEKGDDITLVLTAKGIELDETSQALRWNGSLQSAQFIASIPEDYAKNKAIFTLRVFKEDIPIGHLKFIIKITQEAPTRTEKEALGTEAKRYKKAFVSYASPDRNEVLKRVQMLNKLGIEFFQDLINLNPGERWEQKLYENIDDSDLFLLFWSTAAKESKWVLKELQYAISLKKHEDDNPPVIQPVPIEGPPIVTPPEELGHMHFNDQILYFITE